MYEYEYKFFVGRNLSIELSDVTEQRDRETFERWQLEEEQM